MSKKPTLQSGFAHVGLILLLVIVLGVAGGGGYYVWKKNHDQKKTSDSSQSDKKVADVTNYDECVKSDGSRIQESYPATCVTKDEKRFTQPVVYDPAKTAKIEHFDTASASLKTALVNTFYDDADSKCEQANAGVATKDRIENVMSVKKMVRDDFALVQFCGDGSSKVFVHADAEWKAVGFTGQPFMCSVVDEYQISKEVMAYCYPSAKDTEPRAVTYP